MSCCPLCPTCTLISHLPVSFPVSLRLVHHQHSNTAGLRLRTDSLDHPLLPQLYHQMSILMFLAHLLLSEEVQSLHLGAAFAYQPRLHSAFHFNLTSTVSTVPPVCRCAFPCQRSSGCRGPNKIRCDNGLIRLHLLNSGCHRLSSHAHSKLAA